MGESPETDSLQPGCLPLYVLTDGPRSTSPKPPTTYQEDTKMLSTQSLPQRHPSTPLVEPINNVGTHDEANPDSKHNFQAANLPRTSTRLSTSTFSSSSSASSTQPQESEKDSGRAKRFVGNMLVARLGRAGVSSMASSVKLPLYLSPCGDNNPFTLPNLRKRDLALAGVMHLGADALVDSSLTAMEAVVQHGATWTAEQTLDHGFENFTGVRPHNVQRTAGVTTVDIRIKHKLIGEHAEMRFFEERDAVHKLSCAKGWFCPYLFTSSRDALLPRLKDFTMAEFQGPGLKADAALAPVLLSCITKEDAPVCHLDAPMDDSDSIQLEYQRLAIFFLGISPYRTSSTWSQAKVPGQARLRFHLLTHIPAIVLPVKASAPICAWSPWTMGQITSSRDDYDLAKHLADLLRYVDSLVETSLIAPLAKDAWRALCAASFQQILDGIQGATATLGAAVDAFDPERAGIVMFRY